MPLRGLVVTWASSPYIAERHDGIRIRATVTEACGIPTKIFAYRMRPKSADGTLQGDFSHICSSVDLAEYPEDAPRVGDLPEWFRLDTVDILVRSKQESIDFLARLRSDIYMLVRSIINLDTLLAGGRETVGDTCPTVSSSSMTVSSSSMGAG